MSHATKNFKQEKYVNSLLSPRHLLILTYIDTAGGSCLYFTQDLNQSLAKPSLKFLEIQWQFSWDWVNFLSKIGHCQPTVSSDNLEQKLFLSSMC